MKKTTSITILSIMMTFSLSAQRQPSPHGYRNIAIITDFKSNKEFAKEPLIYKTGFNSEIDENVKWTLAKFWTNSKVSTIDMSNDKIDKTHSYIEIQDWHHKGEGGNFFITEYHAINRSNDIQMIDRGLYISFDNIRKSETEPVLGADKTTHIMACKAITYTMLFCNLVRNLSMSTKEIKFQDLKPIMEANKERLKTTTVLIPKELIDNGVSETVFKNLPFKYKIESSDEIAARIKAGTDVKNYSHLLVYKKDNYFAYALIVDIENGDLLYLNNAGKKGYVVEDKLMTELMEDIDKPFGK